MSEIEFIFRRGTQRLHLAKEPLELWWDPATRHFQALAAGENMAGRTDEGGYFLYFGPLRYCLRTPEGPIIGFQLIDLESFEPEQFVDATFGPRFDVPELGLQRAYVGDIVYAAQRAVGAAPTPAAQD